MRRLETFVESGASATNDKRPELQRMIEAGMSRPALRYCRVAFVRRGRAARIEDQEEAGDRPAARRHRAADCRLFLEGDGTSGAMGVKAIATYLYRRAQVQHAIAQVPSEEAGERGRHHGGATIPTDKLNHLVADHIDGRLLQPKRLETVLASVIDRRQERDEHRREHLVELHRRIAEADQRLGRLFDAIEAGMMDKDDAMAKERMVSLKALRDQAAADTERAQLALDSSGNQTVSLDMVQEFARKERWSPLRAWKQRRSAFRVLF